MSHKRKLAVVAVIEMLLICVLALSLMGCSASIGKHHLNMGYHQTH
jgi:hypothetical protein